MKRKFVSFLTGALLLATVPMQTLAADASVTTVDVTQAGTQTATVTYTQDSAFTVTIPKSITLSSAKTATYDIKKSEKITVTPDATVSMTDANGKDAVDVTITQAEKEFAADNVNATEGSSTTGSVDGSNLTAGSWSGTLNFAIDKVAATQLP